MKALYSMMYDIRIGGHPILSSSGAPVRSHSTIYCPVAMQGSRPSYDTTWEEAVMGYTIKGYNFFSINIMQ